MANKKISEVFMVGQLHQAYFFRKGEKSEMYVMKMIDEGSFEIEKVSPFFNAFNLCRPEIERFTKIKWTDSQLEEALIKSSKKFDALDLFLNGMDISFSEDIRTEALQILSEDFIDDETKAFIKERIFDTETPKQFDPSSTIKLFDGKFLNIMDVYIQLYERDKNKQDERSDKISTDFAHSVESRSH